MLFFEDNVNSQLLKRCIPEELILDQDQDQEISEF
jgi:hypothetical protein